MKLNHFLIVVGTAIVPGLISAAEAGAFDKRDYKRLPLQIETSASHLADAVGLDNARAAFKELSRPMVFWAAQAKIEGVVVVSCSMAKASWVQKMGDTRNPYFGSQMLGCGEVAAPGSAGMAR